MAKKKKNLLEKIKGALDIGNLWNEFVKDNTKWLESFNKKPLSPVPEGISLGEAGGKNIPKPFFDFSEYKVNRPGFENTEIPQPPPEIAKTIWDVFEPRNEATPAAAVAWSESGYDPTAVGGPNPDYNQSYDYGTWQINSNTFNGLLERRPEEMKAIGASTLEDLKDPNINARVAELVRKDEEWSGQQPWTRWFGWQGKNDKGNYLGKDINLQEMISKLGNK